MALPQHVQWHAKPLDEACLLAGDPHPLVVDRIEHLRGLASTAIAPCRGLTCSGGRHLVEWGFVPGRSLAEMDPGEQDALAEDVRAVLRNLHAARIVHGNLKPQNIIVTREGKVVLTHLSPLLHDDPAIDHAALAAMGITMPVQSVAARAPSTQLDAWRFILAAAVLAAGAVAIYFLGAP